MGEENKQNNIDSANIFEEFSQDETLKTEVKDAQQKKEKGIHYYLGLMSNFLKSINIILFLLFILLGGYIYIQNNDQIKNVSYLDPVCGILVNKEALLNGESCGSISSITNTYKELNSEMSTKYYSSIANVIEDVYYVSNFAFSKDILFLLDRTQNRFSALDVLEEFDRLKNEFEPINKGKLLCSNIEISGKGIFTINCEAYSSRWDRNIVGLSGENKKSENVSGTSISMASSFINYLEKNGKDFVLLEKQKEFSYEEVADYGGYSRKTNFKITLKMKSNNLLLK